MLPDSQQRLQGCSGHLCHPSSDRWIPGQWEHYGGDSQKYSMCMQNHAWEIQEIKQPRDKGPAHRQGAAAWAEEPLSPLPPHSVLQMLLPCSLPSYQQGWYIAEQHVLSIIRIILIIWLYAGLGYLDRSLKAAI